MVKWFAAFLILFANTGFALDKLHKSYLISYGEPNSTIQVTEYFSFQCPHCLSLFKKEFKQIKETYLDAKKISFTFHPLPVDLVTVSAMECLNKLSESEKRIFLEVFFEESEINEPSMTIALMQKAMEIFGKPIPELQNKDYLQNSKAFLDAFEFLRQDETIETVPAAEINGQLFANDIPDLNFIHQVLKTICKDGKNAL
jgi:hypothetical protein